MGEGRKEGKRREERRGGRKGEERAFNKNNTLAFYKSNKSQKSLTRMAHIPRYQSLKVKRRVFLVSLE